MDREELRACAERARQGELVDLPLAYTLGLGSKLKKMRYFDEEVLSEIDDNKLYVVKDFEPDIEEYDEEIVYQFFAGQEV